MRSNRAGCISKSLWENGLWFSFQILQGRDTAIQWSAEEIWDIKQAMAYYHGDSAEIRRMGGPETRDQGQHTEYGSIRVNQSEQNAQEKRKVSPWRGNFPLWSRPGTF